MNFIQRLEHLFTLPLSNNIALFALILFVILFAPIATRKLRLPQVIGLIACGVILGPHALNVIDNTGAIGLFSTIGLQYIMFMAGLELDIHQFKATRYRSLCFGCLTCLGPFILIFPTCHFILGMGATESILIGLMFGTHTLIAYPAVSRMGVARDVSVAMTVGGTIIVDAGVLILLAVLLGLHAGNLTGAFWLELAAGLAAFSAIMFLVIPKIGEKFFSHWHNEPYLRYIFIIMMVFISGLMAEIAGLEAIVGSFLAGLVLNRLIPASSALMHNIEFVGNAIFIPIFLLTVGMLVDISVITQGPRTIIMAAAFSTLAIFGKYIAAFASQKIYHYSKAQRRVIFGLSSARVAATLAIVIVAHNVGIIDEIWLNAAILVILISCITASFVTESGARALAIEHESQSIPAATSQYEHILLPIANPQHAATLLDFCAHLAKPQTPITILSVIPDNEHAENNIRTFHKSIAPTVNAISPNRFKTTITIDPEIPEAIARVAREQLATTLIFGWPKSTIAEIITGEKWKAVIKDIDKLLIWGDIPSPITQNKRIILFTLPNAHKECGFIQAVDKILDLARQFSLSIQHFGTPENANAIALYLQTANITVDFQSKECDAFCASHTPDNVSQSDILAFISARPDTLSYNAKCDAITNDWTKYFPKNNKLLIFPSQPNACTWESNSLV